MVEHNRSSQASRTRNARGLPEAPQHGLPKNEVSSGIAMKKINKKSGERKTQHSVGFSVRTLGSLSLTKHKHSLGSMAPLTSESAKNLVFFGDYESEPPFEANPDGMLRLSVRPFAPVKA